MVPNAAENDETPTRPDASDGGSDPKVAPDEAEAPRLAAIRRMAAGLDLHDSVVDELAIHQQWITEPGPDYGQYQALIYRAYLAGWVDSQRSITEHSEPDDSGYLVDPLPPGPDCDVDPADGRCVTHSLEYVPYYHRPGKAADQ